MIENLVSGKKYRILTDAANDVWDRISFWTKASDVHYDDGTTAEEKKPAAMLKRNTAYTVGTIAYETTSPSWVMLRCTAAGTTASTVPTTYGTISSAGTVITDGTAKFTVYDVRPSATLSSSVYQIPTMSLVNNLNSELTVNNTKFYFDYQNGKYGYNTSSNRGASTFFSFGNSSYTIPYLFARSNGDYRVLDTEYVFDVTDYKYFRVESVVSNYGLANFYLEKDGVRIGGAELINSQVDIQGASQIKLVAIGNLGSSFTTVTVSNVHIYN